MYQSFLMYAECLLIQFWLDQVVVNALPQDPAEEGRLGQPRLQLPAVRPPWTALWRVVPLHHGAELLRKVLPVQQWLWVCSWSLKGDAKQRCKTVWNCKNVSMYTSMVWLFYQYQCSWSVYFGGGGAHRGAAMLGHSFSTRRVMSGWKTSEFYGILVHSQSMLSCVCLPRYNHYGWLAVKHQVTYLLSCVTDSLKINKWNAV